MRFLLIYVYRDSDEARINFDFFQEYGMYSTRDTDYVLCVNGEELPILSSDRWERILFRENKGYDFGAWGYVLDHLDTSVYDYFIFINNTVRGPFGERYWIRTFCDLLDDHVKMAGITINCHTGLYRSYFGEHRQSVPHVQSMLWCTDQMGLKIVRPLLDPHSQRDKTAVVVDQEIGISQKILSAGYNIRCILKMYDADYTREDILINVERADGDPWFEGSYFGRSLHPYETIFFKTNRSMDAEQLELCTQIQRLNKWY